MAGMGHVEVDIREFQAALGRLEHVAQRSTLDAAAMAGGLVVEGAAKENIIEQDIIDTGATLNSTQARPGDEAGEVDVGPSTEYAIFHELGTRYITARPFLVPALGENKGALQDAVAEALREALRKAIR